MRTLTLCLSLWRVHTLAAIALLAVTISGAESPTKDQRRKLEVVLYPFIPAKTEFFWNIEHDFEHKNPDVDLEIIDLSANYYDKSKDASVSAAVADVYELDSVFLIDFAQQNRLLPLGALLPIVARDYLTNAQIACTLDGTWYGVPHWVCGNFLFFKAGDNAFASATTLAQLEKAFGEKPQRSQWMLVDLKGKLTLGELYLDAAFDRYGGWDVVQPHLNTFEIPVEDDLKRLVQLSAPGFGRNQHYHETTGFYGRQFARGNGRALIGYSEVLYYVLDETQNGCLDGECLAETSIGVSEVPLADNGSHSISWVDVLAISKTCAGDKLKDAIAFVEFMNNDEVLLRALLPTFERPARHLLPAKAKLYENAELIKAVPLYPKLKSIIERAYPPRAAHINDLLSTFGKRLNEDLGTH